MLSEPLDLRHLGQPRVIASYVVETADGLALFDCGPATCLRALKQRLAEQGLELTDIRHLLLSHIHLDHAGAAGVLVREHPGLRVHVSEVGAPHLADPSRLERSARRLYGDDFDRLWGELAPVPEENIEVAGDRVLDFDCFAAPGHAAHHVCYVRDGLILAGDAAGVRLQPSDAVLPPTPPPEFDLDGWLATIAEIERRRPERLVLTHFGVAEDPGRHLAELRERLQHWTASIEARPDEQAWVAERLDELPAADREAYDQAMPLWQSYAGLRRWADKRDEVTA